MEVDLEAVFNESYERTLGFNAPPKDAERLLASFYDRFIGRSERIREKFKNTDMARQRRMLRQSIIYLMNYFATGNVNDFLHRIAVVHDREHMNIEPDLYDLWLETLLETISEYDPEYSDATGRAWCEVLTPGIAFMKSLYAPDSP